MVNSALTRLCLWHRVTGSPVQTGLTILYVAIASRLFQALAHRLIGKAQPQ